VTFDWGHPDYQPVFEERVRRLTKLRAEPALVLPLWEYYKTRPVAFINDWACTFDPRNPEVGLPSIVPFLLFPKQEEYINWIYERWQKREDGLAEKSRDMGVSWLSVAFAVWMWTFHTGVVVGFGSRKESYVDEIGNPASLFWKARELIRLLPKEFRPDGFKEKEHAPSMRIINPANGSSIIGEAGDNIGRGNRTSLYFVDEAAFIERPDAVDAALSQTSNCKLYVSTPNGAGNPFYRRRHSGKVPVFIFDWHDDPRKDEAWYRKQCETLDPVVVAQEIDRNYESSVSNAFVPAELVAAAQARGPAEVQPLGGLRVGVDVARFGDDKSVITFRKGRVCLKQVVLEKLDVTQVAGRTKSEIMAYGFMPEQIAVDTIGIGAGVADMLRGWFPDRIDRATGKRSPIVVDVNAAIRQGDGIHYNLRARMWADMKEWLKTASIPNDQELKTDLTALRYHFRSGEMMLESKDDAKKRGVKSPDRGDSLALTFAVPTIVNKQAPIRVQSFRPTDAGMGMLG